MWVGSGPEEDALAAEERRGLAVEVRLDRERDESGDFYVAYVLRPGLAHDFQTFGSRDSDEALALAREFIKRKGYMLKRLFRTDSASE